MLFRPVYGPELEVIYQTIAQSNAPLSRQTIHHACLRSYKNNQTISPQSIDDALSFLVAALLIEEQDGFRLTNTIINNQPFQMTLISNLQSLSNHKAKAIQELDVLYFSLLKELFIEKDQLYVEDVHKEANKLRSVSEIGGLSQEKIRSWKRVMSFLGIGKRVATGFQCVYAPKLIQEIIFSWQKEGFIQEFLESQFYRYLPFQTQEGELAQAVTQPFLYLHQQQIITMRAYQDSSSKPYFGQRRWRYVICREGVTNE